jgi:hypothetical protein
MKGHVEVVRVLLTVGAEVNAKDKVRQDAGLCGEYSAVYDTEQF